MSTPKLQSDRMKADEFLTWSLGQEIGRYELLDGEVIAMAPERAVHNETKLQVAVQLLHAVKRAGTACQVFTDGMAVRIDETTVFEPDAMVRCGEKLPGYVTEVSDPVIIVEVRSPSTASIDSNIKLDQYFRVASVHHYLIVRTTSPLVIHHRRTGAGFSTQLVGPGTLRLDPPGIDLQLD